MKRGRSPNAIILSPRATTVETLAPQAPQAPVIQHLSKFERLPTELIKEVAHNLLICTRDIISLRQTCRRFSKILRGDQKYYFKDQRQLFSEIQECRHIRGKPLEVFNDNFDYELFFSGRAGYKNRCGSCFTPEARGNSNIYAEHALQAKTQHLHSLNHLIGEDTLATYGTSLHPGVKEAEVALLKEQCEDKCKSVDCKVVVNKCLKLCYRCAHQKGIFELNRVERRGIC